MAHPKDRRVRLVVLTEAGTATKAEPARSMNMPPAELLELDEAQLRELCAL